MLDIVLKCINQYNSTVEKTFNAKKLKASEEKDQLGDDVLKGYQSKTEMLNQARNVIYKQHADNNWKIEILKSIIPQEASEQERKSDQNANELGKKLSEKEIQRMLYEIMIEKSDTLHDKVADIIKHLNFAVTNPDLLQAIEYYQSNRKVTKNAPFNHLNAIEYKAVYKGEKFEAKLYKSFLFMHIYENVRNGTISLTHSYKYLPIENYMIDEEQWQKNRIHILKRLGLDKFANINDVLKVLQGKLDKVYYDINKRIVNRKNKFVRYGKDGQFVMNTPAVEKPDYQGLAQLFNHFENIPILNIIRDIDNHTSFSSNF